jgi:hypothetical protein
MFADYLALRISSETKLTTKLSKIDNSLRYKAIRTLVINPTKIGLSQARRRTPTPTQRPVRFRGIHNIRDSLNPSNKISKIFLVQREELLESRSSLYQLSAIDYHVLNAVS